jgi:hypothetical protein
MNGRLTQLVLVMATAAVLAEAKAAAAAKPIPIQTGRQRPAECSKIHCCCYPDCYCQFIANLAGSPASFEFNLCTSD